MYFPPDTEVAMTMLAHFGDDGPQAILRGGPFSFFPNRPPAIVEACAPIFKNGVITLWLHESEDDGPIQARMQHESRDRSPRLIDTNMAMIARAQTALQMFARAALQKSIGQVCAKVWPSPEIARQLPVFRVEFGGCCVYALSRETEFVVLAGSTIPTFEDGLESTRWRASKFARVSELLDGNRLLVTSEVVFYGALEAFRCVTGDLKASVDLWRHPLSEETIDEWLIRNTRPAVG